MSEVIPTKTISIEKVFNIDSQMIVRGFEKKQTECLRLIALIDFQRNYIGHTCWIRA